MSLNRSPGRNGDFRSTPQCLIDVSTQQSIWISLNVTTEKISLWLGGTVIVTANASLIVVLPLYMLSNGMSPQSIGPVIAAALIAQGIVRFAAGPVIARTGSSSAIKLGAAGLGIALILLALLPANATLILPRIIQGAGISLALVATYTWIAQTASPDRLGRALGAFGMLPCSGQR
ncbi:MFS transporter [Burkholderia sp. Ac-20353]|uniref:MFS transporter n=1 Tax=Burkholderia sp. Ac-20353 TaxID=2703894 RepID=UPI00197B6B92|nr:MFS transporter [Burkholderia sp. Ac-20353]MBN3792170.1 MFS transporter [Burkholderia sp. Ac-20353]